MKETKCPKGHLELQSILPRTQGQLAIIWGCVEGLVETLARIVKEQTQHHRMRVNAKSLILLCSIYQKAVNLLGKFSHCFSLPGVTDGNFQTATKSFTNKNKRWTLEQKPGRKFSRVKKAFLYAEGQRVAGTGTAERKNSREETPCRQTSLGTVLSGQLSGRGWESAQETTRFRTTLSGSRASKKGRPWHR